VRQHGLKAVHPAMSVQLGDPLVHVIGKFAATKFHRVFVVNDGRLLPVMSLSDVMKYALNASE
jgi:CBS domain-containing protein